MLFRSNDTATTEIYTLSDTLSLHDALPIAVIEIQRIISFLKQRGIGVLITDHNVRETLGICDRAYIINDGSVLAYGKPDEIVYNDSVRKVYLGEHFRL